MITKIQLRNPARKALGNVNANFIKLNALLPEKAFISGGVIRDMYHGTPIKDIDIVIANDKGQTLVFTKAVILQVFPEAKFEELNGRNLAREYRNDDIATVVRVTGCPIKIDIIVRHTFGLTPMDVIDSFDLSINQGVLIKNPNGFLVAHYNTSRFVEVNPENSPSIERFADMQKRFPKLVWLPARKEMAKIYGGNAIKKIDDIIAGKVVEKKAIEPVRAELIRPRMDDWMPIRNNPFVQDIIIDDAGVGRNEF